MEKVNKIMNRHGQREQSQTCLDSAKRQGDAATLKRQLPPLSNLHKNGWAWVWMKRLVLAGLLALAVGTNTHAGWGIGLVAVVVYFAFRSLCRLLYRLFIFLLYLVLLALVLGLIF